MLIPKVRKGEQMFGVRVLRLGDDLPKVVRSAES